MKYAVMFEPFEFEGHQYVREAIDGGSWSDRDSPKTFNTKEEAEKEAKKWNTGLVVNMEENIK
jgi:hypothetical protein